MLRIRMFWGLLDPDPDPLVRGTDPDPDPSIIEQKCSVPDPGSGSGGESGSTSQRHGSANAHPDPVIHPKISWIRNTAKMVRKSLIPTVLRLLFDF